MVNLLGASLAGWLLVSSAGLVMCLEPGLSGGLCEGRPDSVFADSDGHGFVACRGGAAHQLRCPPRQQFHAGYCRRPRADVEAQRCSEPDGVYPDYGSGCRRFFFCRGGRKTSLTCPDSLLFDWRLGRCRQAAKVACPKLRCDADGVFADRVGGCRRYYRCQDGEREEALCPQGQLFDAGRCQNTTSVECEGDNGCASLPDAFYPAPGCAQFVLCVAGNAREFSCPSDLIFSRKQLACDYPRKATCEVPDATCPPGSNGLFPLTGCREFAVCRDGVLLKVGSCPKAMAFDANRLSCRPTGDVKCTFAEEYADTECIGRADGVYPGATADSFYACLGHVKVATSSCPEGSVFDPTVHGCQTKGPVSGNDGVSYGQYECEGRIGVFPDYRTSCYSYRICADGLEVVQDCGGGLSYDTEFGRCVEDASTPCRPPRVVGTFKCPEGSPGLFVDESSGCRFWHECVGSEGVSYACPKGHSFDPERMICRPTVGCTETVLRPRASISVTGLVVRINDTDFDVDCGEVAEVLPSIDRQDFHVCAPAGAFNFRCPSGTVFDPERNACDIDRGTDVTDLALPENADDDFTCDGRRDGLHPDETQGHDCARYYSCEGGRKRIMLCPTGTRFNPVLLLCSSSVLCHVDRHFSVTQPPALLNAPVTTTETSTTTSTPPSTVAPTRRTTTEYTTKLTTSAPAVVTARASSRGSARTATRGTTWAASWQGSWAATRAPARSTTLAPVESTRPVSTTARPTTSTTTVATTTTTTMTATTTTSTTTTLAPAPTISPASQPDYDDYYTDILPEHAPEAPAGVARQTTPVTTPERAPEPAVGLVARKIPEGVPLPRLDDTPVTVPPFIKDYETEARPKSLPETSTVPPVTTAQNIKELAPETTPSTTQASTTVTTQGSTPDYVVEYETDYYSEFAPETTAKFTTETTQPTTAVTTERITTRQTLPGVSQLTTPAPVPATTRATTRGTARADTRRTTWSDSWDGAWAATRAPKWAATRAPTRDATRSQASRARSTPPTVTRAPVTEARVTQARKSHTRVGHARVTQAAVVNVPVTVAPLKQSWAAQTPSQVAYQEPILPPIQSQTKQPVREPTRATTEAPSHSVSLQQQSYHSDTPEVPLQGEIYNIRPRPVPLEEQSHDSKPVPVPLQEETYDKRPRPVPPQQQNYDSKALLVPSREYSHDNNPPSVALQEETNDRSTRPVPLQEQSYDSKTVTVPSEEQNHDNMPPPVSSQKQTDDSRPRTVTSQEQKYDGKAQLVPLQEHSYDNKPDPVPSQEQGFGSKSLSVPSQEQSYDGKPTPAPELEASTKAVETPTGQSGSVSSKPSPGYSGVGAPLPATALGDVTLLPFPQQHLSATRKRRIKCVKTGVFADFKSGCRRYHVCTKSKSKTYECPQGLLFSPIKQMCDVPDKVTCAPPRHRGCVNCKLSRTSTSKTPFSRRHHAHGVPPGFHFQCDQLPDGFYPDVARRCHVFYRCHGGQTFSHYCKGGLLFNAKTGNCDFEGSVDCSMPGDEEPSPNESA